MLRLQVFGAAPRWWIQSGECLDAFVHAGFLLVCGDHLKDQLVMSFRREPLVEVGGFRHELGRVGKIPSGCEETDLCIRIGQLHPEGEIRYDPEAAVDHLVPAARGSLRYFVSRCRGEGRSKAILSALVGPQSGLEAERSYVRRTLPRGFLRGLREALTGHPDGA